MPGQLISGSPTATELNNQQGAAQQSDASPSVGNDEQAASPYEEHMLDKVMGAIFHSLNDPKKIRTIEGWLMHPQGTTVGVAIGHIAFKLLAAVFAGAKSSGVQIPTDVFFAQGGAVQQTIDRIIMLAEHAGVPNLDNDKVREDALGVVVDSTKQMFGSQINQHAAQDAQTGQSPFAQGMMHANPMSHAVGKGLQQQGLLGGIDG